MTIRWPRLRYLSVWPNDRGRTSRHSRVPDREVLAHPLQIRDLLLRLVPIGAERTALHVIPQPQFIAEGRVELRLVRGKGGRLPLPVFLLPRPFGDEGGDLLLRLGLVGTD